MYYLIDFRNPFTGMFIVHCQLLRNTINYCKLRPNTENT